MATPDGYVYVGIGCLGFQKYKGGPQLDLVWQFDVVADFDYDAAYGHGLVFFSTGPLRRLALRRVSLGIWTTTFGGGIWTAARCVHARVRACVHACVVYGWVSVCACVRACEGG